MTLYQNSVYAKVIFVADGSLEVKESYNKTFNNQDSENLKEQF